MPIQTPTEGPNEAPALRFDHLGVVVDDISSGRDFLERALGIAHWTELSEDPGLGVAVQFGTALIEGAPSGPAYELVAPLGDASPIASALRGGKHILNHVAYLTADIAVSGDRLRGEGCFPAGDPQPAIAYGGRRVQFFVSPLRFMIELIESPAHRHKFAGALATSPLDAILAATTSAADAKDHAARGQIILEDIVEARR